MKECLAAAGLPASTNCASVHDCSAGCDCDSRRQAECQALRPRGSAEHVLKTLNASAGVASMVWQPNLFFDWRNQSLTWLAPAIAASGGTAPQLVELGNEHYLDTYSLLMPDADSYVARAAAVGAAVQSAGGAVGLTAEPTAAFDDAATSGA